MLGRYSILYNCIGNRYTWVVDIKIELTVHFYLLEKRNKFIIKLCEICLQNKNLKSKTPAVFCVYIHLKYRSTLRSFFSYAVCTPKRHYNIIIMFWVGDGL